MTPPAGFLGRLAARQLEGGGGLAPRLPGRFEPEPALALAPPDPGPTEGSHEPDRRVPRATRMPVAPDERPVVAIAQPAAVREAAEPRRPVADQADGGARPAVVPPMPALLPELPSAQRPGPQQTAGPARASTRRATPPAVPAQPVPGRVRTERRVLVERVLGPAVAGRDTVDATPAPVHPVWALDGWGSPAFDPGPPPAPAAVHVTIGRLEVRTSPAPGTTPRPEPARPRAIALDDYLDRRHGASRR
jgi:hypothetical protein